MNALHFKAKRSIIAQVRDAPAVLPNPTHWKHKSW